MAFSEEQEKTSSVTPLERAGFQRHQTATTSVLSFSTVPRWFNFQQSKSYMSWKSNRLCSVPADSFVFNMTKNYNSSGSTLVNEMRMQTHLQFISIQSKKNSRVLVKPLYLKESTQMISALQCRNFSKIFKNRHFFNNRHHILAINNEWVTHKLIWLNVLT